MKTPTRKVQRYAKALLDVAVQADAVEAVRADLEKIRGWLKASPPFTVLAACPHLGGREARLRAVLELARAAGLGRLASEFLARIEGGQDLEHLGAILDGFERLRRERAGIVDVEIVSARSLDDGQKDVLARRLGRGREGKRLEMAFKEDPGILGGFVARIGEEIHDYSVSGRMARLRRRLTGA